MQGQQNIFKKKIAPLVYEVLRCDYFQLFIYLVSQCAAAARRAVGELASICYSSCAKVDAVCEQANCVGQSECRYTAKQVTGDTVTSWSRNVFVQ